MSKYVPYFAVLIFVLFGVAFFWSLQRFKKMHEEDKNDETI